MSTKPPFDDPEKAALQREKTKLKFLADDVRKTRGWVEGEIKKARKENQTAQNNLTKKHRDGTATGQDWQAAGRTEAALRALEWSLQAVPDPDRYL